MSSRLGRLLCLFAVEGGFPDTRDLPLDTLDISVQLFNQLPFPGGEVLAQENVGADFDRRQRIVEFMADRDNQLLHRLRLFLCDQLCLLPLFLLPAELQSIHDSPNGLRKLRIGGIVLDDVIHNAGFDPLHGKRKIAMSGQKYDRDVKFRRP